MESFISEIDNPIVKKDIIELGQKIAAHKNGEFDDDKFRSLRLARGVYGQRQQGVQMIRIKLPFGKVNTKQLIRISDVADKYSTGNLHITTRQDIQIHYVSLDKTPELWSELEKDEVTLREACGNTVRNITASSIAGIDSNEPFDVSPYADLVFRYFLRKPFGQELGRKIKVSFSSSDKDDAFSFIHDFGFIPKIENGTKGFKVLVGGGLGAQPFLAKVAYDFLPVESLLPFIEASIRVFDRHGERNSRHKARMKYIISKLGIEDFLTLVEEEKLAVQFKESDFSLTDQNIEKSFKWNIISKEEYLKSVTNFSFKKWVETNVIEQKQSGFFAVFIKVLIGNFSTDQARKLSLIVSEYAEDDIRFTIDQSILLKYINPNNLEPLYYKLKQIGLAAIGYNSVADITACPGTDTCNLGISDSTTVAKVIESIVIDEYPELIYNQDIKIKISGCMNSCGQHGLAHIGFHGSSQKVDGNTLPALQVLLGGGRVGDGVGRIAEKVIKVPSKRVLNVVRFLLNDYKLEKFINESFNEYYDRKSNKYFYNLLKPLTDVSTLKDQDFIDWGHEEQFKTQIGVGECAGVMIDLVGTLIFDAEEKLDNAFKSLADDRFADAIYHAYSGAVQTAKALLLEEKVKCNTQIGIINDFDLHKKDEFLFFKHASFSDFILRINKYKASKEFAEEYYIEMKNFTNDAKVFRELKKQSNEK